MIIVSFVPIHQGLKAFVWLILKQVPIYYLLLVLIVIVVQTEIIIDGKNGYLIPCFNIELMADRIIELIKDSKQKSYQNFLIIQSMNKKTKHRFYYSTME